MNFIIDRDPNTKGYFGYDEININLTGIKFPEYLSEDYFIEYLCSEINKIEFHELGHTFNSNPNVCKPENHKNDPGAFTRLLGYDTIKCPWCAFTAWNLGDLSFNIGAYTGNNEKEFHKRQKTKQNDKKIEMNLFIRDLQRKQP